MSSQVPNGQFLLLPCLAGVCQEEKMRGRSKAGKISQGWLAMGLVWGLDFVPCGLTEPTQECPHPHIAPPVARPDFVLVIPRTALKQDSSLHGLSATISQEACSRRDSPSENHLLLFIVSCCVYAGSRHEEGRGGTTVCWTLREPSPPLGPS